jgi:hypothetical protein
LQVAHLQNKITEERTATKPMTGAVGYESNGAQSSVESNFNSKDSEELESINSNESVYESEFLQS